ncbi:hypothetical protein NHQ30_004006 [Ciborinia camelliae]|nr:hypothetical protein NHQ30_004006 [Ciborinia camelliae]
MASPASTADVNNVSLQAHFAGRRSLNITHDLIETHIAMTMIPKMEKTRRILPILSALTKLDVTPGGGDRVGIGASTAGGKYCRETVSLEGGLSRPKISLNLNGAMTTSCQEFR